MVDLYTPPASLEAQKAQVIARKILPLRPFKCEELDCLSFPFKLDRNCKVRITKELNPKTAVINRSSLLNMNDSILGDMIYGFSKNPYPNPKINKGSSTHQAHFIDLNKFVFARLEKAFKAIEDKSPEKIT